eukprot:scaffold48155_cov67-Phaeocystis_antarctica.AAC.3
MALLRHLLALPPSHATQAATASTTTEVPSGRPTDGICGYSAVTEEEIEVCTASHAATLCARFKVCNLQQSRPCCGLNYIRYV